HTHPLSPDNIPPSPAVVASRGRSRALPLPGLTAAPLVFLTSAAAESPTLSRRLGPLIASLRQQPFQLLPDAHLASHRSPPREPTLCEVSVRNDFTVASPGLDPRMYVSKPHPALYIAVLLRLCRFATAFLHHPSL